MIPVFGNNGEPLTRVLIWKPGPNETDEGILLWNARSIREAMGTYQRRGNALLIDINHNYSAAERAKWAKSGAPAPTAGYARLEVDARGGCWAIPDYSVYGLAKVRGKELRYFSPEFAYDSKTREITDMIRLSLVAEPGTWGARMVASARRRLERSAMPPDMVDKMMELGAMLEKEQVSEGVRALFSEVLAMAQGGAEPAPDALAAEEPAQDQKKDEPVAPMGAAMSAADRFAKKREELQRSALLRDMLAEARRSLHLNPAQEARLSKITDPDQLEGAIGLLAAADRREHKSPRVEPAVDRPAEIRALLQKGTEGGKAPGAHVAALCARFGVTI